MDYKVKVVADNKELKNFLRLPYRIYCDDSVWVPPMMAEQKRVLDRHKNPYFSENVSLELFNCYKSDKICSRLAVIINQHYHQTYGLRLAHFGFFESVNDPQAVALLFEKVEHYLKFHTIHQFEGPFNPNHYSELGILAHQNGSPPAFFQTYNPSYYNELLASVGFQVSKKVHTWSNYENRQYLADKKYNKANFEENGFSVRSFQKNEFDTELEQLRNIFNDAFSENWHFLPVSRSEYRFCAKYINLVTYPQLIRFVEHHGKPVAAIQFVLDINPQLKKFAGKQNIFRYLQFLKNKKHIRKLIVFAVGVKKAYRQTAAFHLLVKSTIEVARDYDVLETTWVSPENKSAVHAAELLGLKADKEFNIYNKKINYGS